MDRKEQESGKILAGKVWDLGDCSLWSLCSNIELYSDKFNVRVRVKLVLGWEYKSIRCTCVSLSEHR